MTDTSTPTSAPTSAATRPGTPPRSLRFLMLLLAVACGVSVANLYYAQPLLVAIGHTFGVGQGTSALIVTLTQAGYALGLALLVPLGDLLSTRAVATRLMVIAAAGLVVVCTSPGFGVLLAGAAVVGATSVAAQVLIPLAAHLAPEAERGRWVGLVTSGLLFGIMLSRSIASLAAAAWGWRTIYGISAGLMIVMALALLRFLPSQRVESDHTYRSLIASIPRLAREEPVLVQRATAQALMFGAFTTFWTGVTYELTVRHGLGHLQVAGFALVGAAGALVAPLAGRLGDAGRGTPARLVSFVLGTVALLVAGFGGGSIYLLAIGAIFLDVAAQLNHVLSMRDIYALRPEARARVNSVYMTTMFLGGAIASAVTGQLSSAYGWLGPCLFAAALTAAGVLLWLATARRHVTSTV